MYYVYVMINYRGYTKTFASTIFCLTKLDLEWGKLCLFTNDIWMTATSKTMGPRDLFYVYKLLFSHMNELMHTNLYVFGNYYYPHTLSNIT